MVVFPNAKINLGLNVLNRRPDGYHDISTVFLPVGWSDILEIVPAKGLETTLSVTGRVVDCPPEKNLVMKAYHRLAQEVELPPVDICLHKVIPDGAGLGGGSSDAAFTLVALRDMFAKDISDDKLAAIAGELGADCSFFVYNKPMIAKGIGTELSPIDIELSGLHIAIVKPKACVSTKEAYSGVIPAYPNVALENAIEGFDITNPASLKEIKNDFEASVLVKFPEIANAKELMIGLGAEYVAMSGSGSAIFGIFSEGDNLSARVANAFPDLEFYVGRF